MTIKINKSDYIIVPVLLLLSAIPIFAGVLRLEQLAKGLITEESLRFHANPAPIIFHIIAVTLYSVLGGLQFSESLRKQYNILHRQIGLVALLSGSLASLTGLWMTAFYPSANFDGAIIFFARWATGLGMLFSITKGIIAIRNKSFHKHGEWMIRAYALGMGAATQVFTHIPWFLFPNIQGKFARTIFMISGWVINIILAEWIINKIRYKKGESL